MALNTATSIVDFLKSRGLKPQAGEKFPFFDTRTQLYGKLGLSANMGEFRGTKDQNIALLQSLTQSEKSTGISITPENLFNVATVAQGGGTRDPSPIIPTPSEETRPDITKARPSTMKEGVVSEGGITTGGEGIPREPFAPPTFTPIPGTTPVPIQPKPDRTFFGTGGDVSGLLPQIPEAGDVTQQALEMVQQSATFPLTMEAQEAEKEAIRLGSQRQKESFITDIASRGLFFSGKKT